MNDDLMEKVPPVTMLILLTNAVIFVLSETVMKWLIPVGLMDYDLVSQGQIYRLVSAAFLHDGIEHIIGNMLLLFAMGGMVETAAGSFKYAAIYLISAIAGNACSFYFESATGLRYASLGASGAVYGILGALIVMAVRKVRGIRVVRSRIPLAVIYCIYTSFAMPNIDYAAHIGGMLAGMLLSYILVKPDDERGLTW
ncbi:MAG: rhomboid family intramembrane serine protease [Lachnospiraceae bacterium]|nr:rhomboid family intramembrane serine protease [Lachnospiraceae bacterium]